MKSDRIAVIGAGGGGSACAVGFSLDGFKVSLCGRSFSQGKRAEIEFTGEVGEGTVSLGSVTSNIKEAIEDAGTIFVIVPAFAQKEVARQLFQTVTRKQIVVFAPGACASIESRFLLDKVDLIGELLTIPYGGRVGKRGLVDISAPMRALGTKMRAASFPASNNDRFLEAFTETINVKPAANVIETGLLNPSSLVHPSIMLLNLGSFENKSSMFSELRDGYTSSAERLVQLLDVEKQSVCKAFGVASLSLNEVYQEFAGLRLDLSGRRMDETKRGIYSIQERFVTEDVPYGLVLISSLAKLVRVETPLIDSVVRVFSAARGENYFETGRNISNMSIEGFSKSELLTLVQNGPTADS